MSICNTPRFLITTADERSWHTDRPVLFLGEWCRLYKHRALWEQLDAEIVPYHWDDREQLYRDYLYLRGLYECLLVELSDALNVFHGVQHTQRYWRILVGPWLGAFTQMLFDRWTMIQSAVRDYEISGTIVLDYPPEQVIPNDMADFAGKFVNDLWNHHISGRILSDWTSVSCERISVPTSTRMQVAHHDFTVAFSLRYHFRRLGRHILTVLSSSLSRPTDAIFISTYLPLKQDFRLQLALGQIPQRWRSLPPPQIVPIQQIRKRFFLAENDASGFEQCVRRLIAEQLPTLYLEGYKNLQETADNLPWPKRPRVLFTSTSHIADDVFKAWAGAMVESGFPLVIGQHGGTLGTALWSFFEEHEQNIADRYLTWGWSDNVSKQYPACALVMQGEPLGLWNPYGGILLVTVEMPRYSYYMYSGMVAGQMIGYMNEQFRFAAALPDNLRKNLFVRLYPGDHGWSPTERWVNQRNGDVQFASNNSPLMQQISQSRLVVITYNATSFLETLGLNIPTIIFWNPKHWELRRSALPYFDRLKTAGILHETPESASAKVTEVWNDVASWWNQPEVQDARHYFCDRFARMPKNPTEVLKEALTTLPDGKVSEMGN